MKNLNLIRILFFSCLLLSCEPKKEKKEPIIINNNQNFKYDDEPVKVKTDDSITKKEISTKKR